MQARDVRSIGRAAQEELHRRALFLIEQQGLSQGQAAQMVGVHRQTVNIWLKRYRQQDWDGVLDGRRVSPRRGHHPRVGECLCGLPWCLLEAPGACLARLGERWLGR